VGVLAEPPGREHLTGNFQALGAGASACGVVIPLSVVREWTIRLSKG
jgi:hypothetical protein